ncbi:unnamed protein product [Owenia fusiformis]|uniref:Intraflagellar transport protein 25 homolog n=2 Tax=Owenia fusiformis TaxID=6347 RepID=A0A8S4N4B0_OWEFU|nr:unnamed protein product [Owenia fusiformis]
MFDVALANAGAQVVLATSSDEKHPPENMIDGQTETFWTSTGMFPQEFIISFQQLMNVNTIKMDTFNVKGLQLERSVQNEPNDFQPLDEKDLVSTDGQLQHNEFSFSSTTAQHLRVVINSGHDHFISVHKLHVDGTAVHNS